MCISLKTFEKFSLKNALVELKHHRNDCSLLGECACLALGLGGGRETPADKPLCASGRCRAMRFAVSSEAGFIRVCFHYSAHYSI